MHLGGDIFFLRRTKNNYPYNKSVYFNPCFMTLKLNIILTSQSYFVIFPKCKVKYKVLMKFTLRSTSKQYSSQTLNFKQPIYPTGTSDGGIKIRIRRGTATGSSIRGGYKSLETPGLTRMPPCQGSHALHGVSKPFFTPKAVGVNSYTGVNATEDRAKKRSSNTNVNKKFIKFFKHWYFDMAPIYQGNKQLREDNHSSLLVLPSYNLEIAQNKKLEPLVTPPLTLLYPIVSANNSAAVHNHNLPTLKSAVNSQKVKVPPRSIGFNFALGKNAVSTWGGFSSLVFIPEALHKGEDSVSANRMLPWVGLPKVVKPGKDRLRPPNTKLYLQNTLRGEWFLLKKVTGLKKYLTTFVNQGNDPTVRLVSKKLDARSLEAKTTNLNSILSFWLLSFVAFIIRLKLEKPDLNLFLGHYPGAGVSSVAYVPQNIATVDRLLGVTPKGVEASKIKLLLSKPGHTPFFTGLLPQDIPGQAGGTGGTGGTGIHEHLQHVLINARVKLLKQKNQIEPVVHPLASTLESFNKYTKVSKLPLSPLAVRLDQHFCSMSAMPHYSTILRMANHQYNKKLSQKEYLVLKKNQQEPLFLKSPGVIGWPLSLPIPPTYEPGCLPSVATAGGTVAGGTVASDGSQMGSRFKLVDVAVTSLPIPKRVNTTHRNTTRNTKMYIKASYLLSNLIKAQALNNGSCFAYLPPISKSTTHLDKEPGTKKSLFKKRAHNNKMSIKQTSVCNLIANGLATLSVPNVLVDKKEGLHLAVIHPLGALVSNGYPNVLSHTKLMKVTLLPSVPSVPVEFFFSAGGGSVINSVVSLERNSPPSLSLSTIERRTNKTNVLEQTSSFTPLPNIGVNGRLGLNSDNLRPLAGGWSCFKLDSVKSHHSAFGLPAALPLPALRPGTVAEHKGLESNLLALTPYVERISSNPKRLVGLWQAPILKMHSPMGDLSYLVKDSLHVFLLKAAHFCQNLLCNRNMYNVFWLKSLITREIKKDLSLALTAPQIAISSPRALVSGNLPDLLGKKAHNSKLLLSDHNFKETRKGGLVLGQKTGNTKLLRSFMLLLNHKKFQAQKKLTPFSVNLEGSFKEALASKVGKRIFTVYEARKVEKQDYREQKENLELVAIRLKKRKRSYPRPDWLRVRLYESLLTPPFTMKPKLDTTATKIVRQENNTSAFHDASTPLTIPPKAVENRNTNTIKGFREKRSVPFHHRTANGWGGSLPTPTPKRTMLDRHNLISNFQALFKFNPFVALPFAIPPAVATEGKQGGTVGSGSEINRPDWSNIINNNFFRVWFFNTFYNFDSCNFLEVDNLSMLRIFWCLNQTNMCSTTSFGDTKPNPEIWLNTFSELVATEGKQPLGAKKKVGQADIVFKGFAPFSSRIKKMSPTQIRARFDSLHSGLQTNLSSFFHDPMVGTTPVSAKAQKKKKRKEAQDNEEPHIEQTPGFKNRYNIWWDQKSRELAENNKTKFLIRELCSKIANLTHLLHYRDFLNNNQSNLPTVSPAKTISMLPLPVLFGRTSESLKNPSYAHRDITLQGGGVLRTAGDNRDLIGLSLALVTPCLPSVATAEGTVTIFPGGARGNNFNFTKYRQKQQKLNYLGFVPYSQPKGLINALETKKQIVEKKATSKFWWLKNTSFNALYAQRRVSGNTLDASRIMNKTEATKHATIAGKNNLITRMSKVLAQPPLLLLPKVSKGFVRVEAATEAGLHSILHPPIFVSLFSMATTVFFHFCCLIGLLSISQVRCVIKFYFLLFYKLSKSYIQVISSLYGCTFQYPLSFLSGRNPSLLTLGSVRHSYPKGYNTFFKYWKGLVLTNTYPLTSPQQQQGGISGLRARRGSQIWLNKGAVFLLTRIHTSSADHTLLEKKQFPYAKGVTVAQGSSILHTEPLPDITCFDSGKTELVKKFFSILWLLTFGSNSKQSLTERPIHLEAQIQLLNANNVLFSLRNNSIKTLVTIVQKSRLLVIKSVALLVLFFQHCFEAIVRFFEKPTEVSLDFFAYTFLVELYCDCLSIMPEVMDLTIWNWFQKTTGSLKTSLFFGNLLQRRFFCFFYILLNTLNQPDTALIRQQAKASLFWDLWADLLIKTVVSENQVDVSALSRLEEERTSLVDNLLFEAEASSFGTLHLLPKQRTRLLHLTKIQHNFIDSPMVNPLEISALNHTVTATPYRINKESKVENRWGANQHVSYQQVGTDLFVDLNVSKSFSHVGGIKYYAGVQYPIGSLVCQIYTGLFEKQPAKNVLVLGPASASTKTFDAKSLLIQALAGETEIRIIMDNAARYTLINRGLAVGIRLLKEVFNAIALQTPCFFLLEDVHLIGDKRLLLISDSSDAKKILNNKMPLSNIDALEVHEKNQIMIQYSKQAVTHYKKPYRDSAEQSVATNQYCFHFFSGHKGKRVKGTSLGSAIPITSSTQSTNKKLKPKKVLTEISFEENSKEPEFILVPRINYSVRLKVALLAQHTLSHFSAKVDMITDLLVIIDNVRCNKGFVVFATTNRAHRLDPALRRPGRLDETIRVPFLPTASSRWEILKSNMGSFFKSTFSPLNVKRSVCLDLIEFTNFSIQVNSSLLLAPLPSFYPTIGPSKSLLNKRLGAEKHSPTSKKPRGNIGSERVKIMAYCKVAKKVILNSTMGSRTLDVHLPSVYAKGNPLYWDSIKMSKLNRLGNSENLTSHFTHLEKSEHQWEIPSGPIAITTIKKKLLDLFASKVAESFVCQLVNQKHPMHFSLDDTASNDWKKASSLVKSFLQKRYMYNKNTIVNSLLCVANGSFVGEFKDEPTNPPHSVILAPSKRYENYKKIFAIQQKKVVIQFSEKIKLHQQQKFQTNLYKLQTYKGAGLKPGQNQVFDRQANSGQTFRPGLAVTDPKESNNSIEHNYSKLSSVSCYYNASIVKRHQFYLTNQWFNGQLAEHNAETVFLSDVDWRFTFIEQLGDLSIDFPDADQLYNPRHRRWFTSSLSGGTASNWHSFYDYDQEISDHLVMQAFNTIYVLLDKNRQQLDALSYKLIKTGFLKELHFVKLML